MSGPMMTIYAAEPEAFIILCREMSSPQTSDKEGERLYERLGSYPQADFTLDLRLYADTDLLCQAMIAEGLVVPASSQELFGEPLWFDGGSSLYQLPATFSLVLARTSVSTIERIAEHWASSLSREQLDGDTRFSWYQEFLESLTNLRETALTALNAGWPLLLWVVY